MTSNLTQQELESYLWGSAVVLRGLVDAGDYKQFVFPLIYFKRLSDVWDEGYATALEESGDESYALATTNDRFLIPAGAHWNDMPKGRDGFRHTLMGEEHGRIRPPD